MLPVVCLLTAGMLILVQARMRSHVREDLAQSLDSQSVVYTKIEQARQAQTRQSAMLLANLPSLKALMSTNDRATVQDGSESFLTTSAIDLLALENAEGEVLAFHAKSADVPVAAVENLLHSASGHDWWFVGGHLFEVSIVPNVAGAGEHRHLLGRVAVGREVTPEGIADAGSVAKSNVFIEQRGKVILSSLLPTVWADFQSGITQGRGGSGPACSSAVVDVYLAGEHYLSRCVELSGEHPVQLYSVESYDRAASFLSSLNRMLLALGVLAVVGGAFIIFGISRQITRPLERLAESARQMEKGEFEFSLKAEGRDEVAAVTRSFDQMRNSLRQSREGMLRAARLEAVGRLAGGVAHDFNNLVMIIKGYSDLVIETVPAEMRSYVEEIKRAGERASGLTRQLLAFSRKQVLEPQVLDPNQTVQNMVKMLRILIGADVELVTSLSDQIGRVLADPGQLEQVVMNLAVNARDAMPKGGKLIIETSACQLDEAYAASHKEVAPGAYVLLAVTDTGSGMTKETMTHIFEPFFTTKGPGKGTGLGLATVYGIVKQSKGHTTVYSEPGVGTTFKIYLPATGKAATASAAQSKSAPPRGHGTILLVEDEAALRALSAESLKRLGYDVLPAANGIEALTLAEQSGPIDLLITDVVMPKMGGLELVEKLKATRPGLRVIFISGYAEAAAHESAGIPGDAILLNKPFSADALARKISEIPPRAAAVAAGSK